GTATAARSPGRWKASSTCNSRAASRGACAARSAPREFFSDHGCNFRRGPQRCAGAAPRRLVQPTIIPLLRHLQQQVLLELGSQPWRLVRACLDNAQIFLRRVIADVILAGSEATQLNFACPGSLARR